MTIQDILNINIPLEFGCDEDGEYTSAIEEMYDQLDGSVNTTYGATKFVIFLNDKEVVKIPFNGCFWWDYKEDGLVFCNFQYSDYCAMEEEMYNKAEEAGVEQFFVSTKYYGNAVSGVPVYVSERVYTFYDNDKVRERTNSFTENSMTKAKELKDRVYTRLHDEWIARAIEYYGYEAVEKLFDFIEEEDIRDLHTNNIGFREDGSPCILDYSSYYEG